MIDRNNKLMSLPLAAVAVVFLAAMSVNTQSIYPLATNSDEGFGDTCAAQSMQYLVGQQIGEVDLDTLPHPFEVHEQGRTPLEVSEQGFQTNVEFSADGRVTGVYCG